jgi:hypothetical protein
MIVTISTPSDCTLRAWIFLYWVGGLSLEVVRTHLLDFALGGQIKELFPLSERYPTMFIMKTLYPIGSLMAEEIGNPSMLYEKLFGGFYEMMFNIEGSGFEKIGNILYTFSILKIHRDNKIIRGRFLPLMFMKWNMSMMLCWLGVFCLSQTRVAFLQMRSLLRSLQFIEISQLKTLEGVIRLI